MGNRSNDQFNSVFGDTIWVDHGGQGFDTVARQIQDGFGNASMLSIGTNIFNIDTTTGGVFTINNVPFEFFPGASVITATANSGFVNERILTQGNNINVIDAGPGGNITVSLVDNPVLTGNEGLTVPVGTIAQRPLVPNTFEMRGNTDLNDLEVFDGVSWINILTGGTGAPIDATYITQIPNGFLTSAQPLSVLGSGILASTTATGVVNSCVLTGTASQITITNGSGIAGNPTFSLPADVIISTSITVDELLINNQGIEATGVSDNIFLTTNNLASVIISNSSQGGTLEFENAAGTFSVGFKAGTLAADTTWTLPTTDSTGAQSLVSNGSGVLSWNTFLPIAGGTMTGNLILNTDPTSALQAATKQYVDAFSSGLSVKAPALAATTVTLTATYANGAAGVGATLTNSGAQAAFSVDGVSPASTDRILVKDQSTTFQNGIYTLTTVGSGATNWVLTRATDFDTAAEITSGSFVIVTMGTVNTNTGWIETATVTTVGTDPVLFSQFGNPGTVTSVSGTAGQITVTSPTSTPVISIDATYVGQTSITTLGTIATGTWSATNIALNKGGTNAALTADLGGIFYSTATAGAILASTATARQMLQSGASAAPAWSTATYPATTNVNRILYSSSANVVGQITTANSGVLITSAGGVPSISTTIPATTQQNITSLGTIASGVWNGTAVDAAHGGTGNTTFTAYSVICAGTTSTGIFQNVSGVGTSGQVLTSSGAAALPTWTTLVTATWVDQTSSPVTMTVNTNYVADLGTLLTFTLPSTAALGSTFTIVGKGAGGWKLGQAASQQINFGTSTTTSGTGGSLASTNTNDCVSVVCVTANTNFVVYSSVGDLTVV